MHRLILATAGLAALIAPAALRAQGSPPVVATDITAEDVQAVLAVPGGGDRLIKAVDMGTYTVGVGVLSRGPTTPGAPVSAIMHKHITEVYYVVSGEGTLLTGGVVTGQRDVPADSEIVKVAVGESVMGTFEKPAQRRRIKTGDIVIIPPGVYHGFDEVATGITYVSTRPDPMKVLPAGYVHPALQK